MYHHEIQQLVVRTGVHYESTIFAYEHDEETLVLDEISR